MLKKTLTLRALALLLSVGGLSFTQLSCTQSERKEVSQESDQAYNDFKDYVASVETKADAAAAETEADYNAETAQLKADFDAKVAAVDRYADQYDDTRRQEIEQLRTRYTTAYDKRDMAWRNRGTAAATGTPTMGKYYTLSNPASRITAANARATYEEFVSNVKAHEDQYDINDWRNINNEWRALDEAYDKVKGDIPARDLAEIQKEKLKYAAFKSADKADIRGEQAVDGTADERSAVGQAASNTASDVKEAGKDVGRGAAKVGSKVGNAVKGAYKEVKSEVKNTDND